MDRALNAELLRAALETHVRLPTPDELQNLLAEAEISLFTREAQIDDALLDAAWYLQSVAIARPDLELYDLPRQRQAHQVSGHIFDLAIDSSDFSALERMRVAFAAQVGYLGGDLTPNAAAIARRIDLPEPPYEWSDPGTMSLEAGIAMLALDRPRLYPLLAARREQLDERRTDNVPDPLAAVDGVIRGVFELTNYLTYGNADALAAAQQQLISAARARDAEHDADSRWVATHLLRISGKLATTSVWATVPPDVPGAARALTLGDPPVLALWPPQLDFLTDDSSGASPLDPSAKRLVLSFPTSAGKTLLAQILIVTHIASTDSEVCVVAPTHALCRELALTLDRRLRTLGYELHRDDRVSIHLDAPPNTRVTVMTPEKLSALIRRDPDEILNRFSMFVVDEAHLVADEHRGWGLEETLSFLHHHTRSTNHRIVVLSAALGSQAHVSAWLNDGTLLQRNEQWRGPRRLNAVFTTVPDWDSQTDIPATGSRLRRTHTPLIGRIHLSAGDRTVQGDFEDNVGTLVMRETRAGTLVRDSDQSTRQRDLLVPVVLHVAESGPVLTVQATRFEAQRFAEAVAEQINEPTPETFALRDLAINRLGSAHPLTSVLERGVAFHHAALPTDIQAEIEDAVRRGQINILVATTTLTEGVNLPFKTVVVGPRGFTSGEEFVEIINPAALLNAVGRAGRAGRESEGWMIVTEQRTFDTSLFDQMNRTGADLDMASTLSADLGVAVLRAYNEQAMSDDDSALRHYSPGVDGFLSYIWFLAEHTADETQTLGDVLNAIRATLAWQQLDPSGRADLEAVATDAVNAYVRHDPRERARWSRTGTSLPSARVLDALAEEVLERCRHRTDFSTVKSGLTTVLDGDTLDTLLRLEENQRRGFKPHRSAPRTELVDVDLTALVLDWVDGLELSDLAGRHLAGITNEEYRYEQLAEFSAQVLEHHLPWTIGIIVAWVNDRLETSGHDQRLPDELPAAVHFGVSSPAALSLMANGVRSRRLANAVADVAPDPDGNVKEGLRRWLASQTAADWTRLLDASPTEVADLLSYVRARRSNVLTSLFDGASVVLDVDRATLFPRDDGPVTVVRPSDHPAAPIELHDPMGDLVGTVAAADHNDAELILATGVPVDLVSTASDDGLQVRITLG